MEDTTLTDNLLSSSEYHDTLEEMAAVVPTLQAANQDLTRKLNDAHTAISGLVHTNDRLRHELELTNKALDKALEHMGVFLPENCHANSIVTQQSSQQLLELESKLGKAWSIIAKLEKDKRNIHSQLLYHKYLRTPREHHVNTQNQTYNYNHKLTPEQLAKRRTTTHLEINKHNQEANKDVASIARRHSTVSKIAAALKPPKRKPTSSLPLSARGTTFTNGVTASTRSNTNYRELPLGNITNSDQDANNVEIHTFRVPKEFVNEQEWQIILTMINKKLDQKRSLMAKLKEDIEYLEEEEKTLQHQKITNNMITKSIQNTFRG